MNINESFLEYSIKNNRAISIIYIKNGTITRNNMKIHKIDHEKHIFTASKPGQKKENDYALNDILSASYARGDKGEIEDKI